MLSPLLYNANLLHLLQLQGSYSLKMKLFDGNKNELTCITFGFDIGFGGPVADS
jgi:hypothetical protein